MKTHSAIVAAVDFSSSSAQVLAHSAKLASGTGNKVVASHVIPESRIKDWEATMGEDAPAGDQMADIRNRLEQLVSEFCSDVETEIEVRIGRPKRKLEEIVQDHAAVMLVLGAHDVSRGRLGSVAAHCARAIRADVLILRDWQGKFFRKIAACVDFSESSAEVMELAISTAKAHEASLEIIHVVFPPARDPWGRVLDQRMDSEVSFETRVWDRARKRMDDFLKPYAGRLGEIESKTVFLEAESPAAAIAAHVDSEAIDLTVIGSQEGSWISDLVLGSNTERLMHDSSSSVLIAR